MGADARVIQCQQEGDLFVGQRAVAARHAVTTELSYSKLDGV